MNRKRSDTVTHRRVFVKLINSLLHFSYRKTILTNYTQQLSPSVALQSKHPIYETAHFLTPDSWSTLLKGSGQTLL